MTLVYLRGATAHELQLGRLIVRACHLSRAYRRWRPSRRLSLAWDRD